MKIADFFVEVTTKGDIKVLKDALKYQKEMKKIQLENDKLANKIKAQNIKKETSLNNAQTKLEIEQIKAKTKLEVEQIKITNRQEIEKKREKAREARKQAKAEQQAKVEKEKQAKAEEKKRKALKYQLAEALKAKIAQKSGLGNIAKSVISTDKLVAGMTSVAGIITGIVASTLILTVAIDKMVLKLAQANQLYINFQRQTGLNMQSAIGFSGAMMGTDITMSPEDIMANMQTLQGNLTGIEFGMGNVMPYQVLGQEAWGTNADEMLLALRKKLKPYDAKYRTFLLQQMGLDPRLGALADMSDEDFQMNMAQGKLFTLDPKLKKELTDMGISANKMFKAFAKTKDLLLVLAGKFITPFTEWITKILNVTNSVIEALEKVPHLLDIISVAVDIILSVITRGLYPIILIVEDLIAWATGNGSFFKDVADKITGKKKKEEPVNFTPIPSANTINTVNNANRSNSVNTSNNNVVNIGVTATDGTSGENIANAIKSSLPFNYANTFFGGSTYA